MRLKSFLLYCIWFLYSELSFSACDKHYEQSTQQVPLSRSSTRASGFNFTSPSPHIFASLRYLLQQWPNTYLPNGHSIVPCDVPPYTNLYHGRRDGEMPASPEWFAFDIEMAYGIMGSTRNSHILTFQTTKQVQCLYFDGMSAALQGIGRLDSQNVFLCGNVTCPYPSNGFTFIGDEYGRAQYLCKWIFENRLGGFGWGLEGIVRMNAGFEMIWCDFGSPSIQLISHLNVTVPLLPNKWKLPGDDDDDDHDGGSSADIHNSEIEEIQRRAPPHDVPTAPLTSTALAEPEPRPPDLSKLLYEPYLISAQNEWLRSATWHYGTSGIGSGAHENRIWLKTCGFMSYHDPMFKKMAAVISKESQVLLNLTTDGSWKGTGPGRKRTIALKQLVRRSRRQTLAAMDPEEAMQMNAAMLHNLLDLNTANTQCTGVDWALVASNIATRYSSSLSQLNELLSQAPTHLSNVTALRHFLFKVREKGHAFLVPFFEYPPLALEDRIDFDRDWTLESMRGRAALKRCNYAYTSLLYDETGQRKSYIKPNELVMLKAVEDVLQALCSTTIKIGMALEYQWLFRFNNYNRTPQSSSYMQSGDLSNEISTWHAEIEELIAYLSWSSDTMRCEKLCKDDEYCLIPMWPLVSSSEEGNDPCHGYPGKCDPSFDPNNDIERGLWHPQCVKLEYSRTLRFR